jgi:hypothetical protein
MALGDKPADLPEWGSGGSAEITEPSLGVKQVGWKAAVNPPTPQWFNWWMNLVFQWLAWVNLHRPARCVYAGAVQWVPATWTPVTYPGTTVSQNISQPPTYMYVDAASQRFEFPVDDTSNIAGVVLATVTDRDTSGATGPYTVEAVYNASAGRVYAWVYRADGTNVMDSPALSPLDAFYLQFVVY